MTKLKTLQEICNEFRTEPEGSYDEERGINGQATAQHIEKRLKKEAIKWVKAINNCAELPTPIYGDGCSRDYEDSMECFVRYFFNITPVELTDD